jgi:hypothetical protein
MSKKRAVSIKYTSREFDSIKSDLVDYIKRYYPNSYRDFSEASFGSLMIDTVSYIGDILSFYIDYQANETFLDTATEYNNIIKLGRQLGYNFKTAPSSFGFAAFYVIVPAAASGIGPDERYYPTLKKGSSFSTTAGTSFILNHDVHFGNSKNEIRVARVNESTGNPEFYAVKTYGQVVSGRIEEEFITVSSFERFRRITLDKLDVADIISVTDEEGNEYYEVDYMSQNIVYKGITNRSKTIGNTVVSYATGDQAAEILKPVVVPRRFIVENTSRTTHLTFGASSDYQVSEDFISEPQTAILEVHGKNYIQDTALDPTNLISSDKMGVGPSNTILTISYRVNTRDNVNIRVGQLNGVDSYEMEINDVINLDAANVDIVRNSVEVDNEEPIVGDITLPDSEELKHRVRGSFATQSRAVTQQDYESFIYQMPTRFGAVKRCRILRDNDSLKRNLNLYMISEDANEHLTQSNEILKENVKTWIQKNKMINDTIDILDAKVLNLCIDFVAVGFMEKSKFEVYETAKSMLIEKFKKIPDIGEPFFITDVYKELRKVEGIADVTDVRISLKSGTNSERSYSSVSFDLAAAASPDGRYIEMPSNVLYEVKFPRFDINGVII